MMGSAERRATTLSSVKSTATSISPPESAKKLLDYDEFSKIIFLLRLATILGSKKGDDASLHSFAEDAYTRLACELQSDVDLSQLTPLDTISAILAQNHDIIAACYQSGEQANLTIIDSEENNKQVIDDGIHADLHVQYTQLPLDVTAMSNPDNKNNSSCQNAKSEEPRLPHNLRLAKGRSHWKEVCEDPFLFISKDRIPLEDHAATVCSYLSEYATSDSDHRAIISDKFSYYLVTVCWRKMLRRVRSWQGTGFIHLLSTQSWAEERINSIDWQSVKYSEGTMRRDNMLVTLLKSHPTFFTLLKKTPGKPSFESFKAAIQRGAKIYTKETVADFHCLLFACFFLFFQKLEQLPLYLKADDALKVHKAVRMLSAIITLLQSILMSGSFKLHIQISTQDGAVLQHLVPVLDNRESYELARLQMLKDAKLSSPYEDRDNLDQEQFFIDMSEPREGVQLNDFIGWIRHFIYQFIGKRALEELCLRGSTNPIKITILTANREEYSVPSWEEFKTVIEKTMELVMSHQEIKEFITNLERKIKSFSYTHQETRRFVDIFKSLLKSKKRTHMTGMHAEAMLVSLALYYDEISPPLPPKLLQTCQTLNGSVISVPKLCCPVCWELLGILRGSFDSKQRQADFINRGCHSTIYPVVLPKWLPSSVTEEMVTKFRPILRKELEKLVLGEAALYKKGDWGHQSETNISDISTGSQAPLLQDFEDDVNNYSDDEF